MLQHPNTEGGCKAAVHSHLRLRGVGRLGKIIAGGTERAQQDEMG